MKLKRSFFTQPSLDVSKKLLGKYIVRKIGNYELIGKIVETESYPHIKDKASHTYLPRENSKNKLSAKEFHSRFVRHFGKKTDKMYKIFLRGGGKLTPRTSAEYLIGGHIYIYLVYGMYWQFNISTGPAEKPECVLIRALEPLTLNQESRIKNYGKIQNNKNHDLKFIIHNSKIANGPGKLCRWLKLDKSFYGEDLTKSKKIWLEQGEKIKPSQIIKGPRINIDYAGRYWAKKHLRFYIKNNPFVSKK